MDHIFEHMEDIIRCDICGFHQYCLTPPFRLGFVSDNLCELLGVSREELTDRVTDAYAARIHPADQEAYASFLLKLSQREERRTLAYRLIKADGGILHVNDTVSSKRQNDGTMIGSSVLSDITELKRKNDELQFLNETTPCGFLKYTCEKHPKITYINEQMLKLLHYSQEEEGALEELELYKGNIFLMIPPEERRRFARYLSRVDAQSAPVAGEMSVLRFDGSKGYLFGWVTKCTNEQGAEEFQSVCMDVTERYLRKKENETQRYLKALSDVYDKIFAYDLAAGTVKCLYAHNSAKFAALENIPMQMEDATEKWLVKYVCEEDQEKFRAYFREFYQKKYAHPDSQPPQIRYRALSSQGEMKHYRGIFLKMDENVSLFCCCNTHDEDEIEQLRTEASSLKSISENMQELVMRFTEGIAAFEVHKGCVTPLYTSDNVCEFFGIPHEEWLAMMKKSTPIKEFVARSDVAYEEFQRLLDAGEAEFLYYDVQKKAERRIKAICSRKSPLGKQPRYVMLYNVPETPAPLPAAVQPCVVNIRTFGYFDVFVDGRPIAFRSQKSKELFALLVDRRGGYVSSEEVIGFLWEDESVNAVTLARYRKVALRLKNILEEYGIADVMESVDGKRRLVTERVQCDLYDYLSGKEEFAQLFKGNYLTNYSWGENTLATLSIDSMYYQEKL